MLGKGRTATTTTIYRSTWFIRFSLFTFIFATLFGTASLQSPSQHISQSEPQGGNFDSGTTTFVLSTRRRRQRSIGRCHVFRGDPDREHQLNCGDYISRAEADGLCGWSVEQPCSARIVLYRGDGRHAGNIDTDRAGRYRPGGIVASPNVDDDADVRRRRAMKCGVCYQVTHRRPVFVNSDQCTGGRCRGFEKTTFVRVVESEIAESDDNGNDDFSLILELGHSAFRRLCPFLCLASEVCVNHPSECKHGTYKDMPFVNLDGESLFRFPGSCVSPGVTVDYNEISCMGKE